MSTWVKGTRWVKVPREASPPLPFSSLEEKEDRTQRDRCVEVYHETVRQRNNAQNSNKVDIKNPSAFHPSSCQNNNDVTSHKSSPTRVSPNGREHSPPKVKKFLPSVKALRNQFETRSSKQEPMAAQRSPVLSPSDQSEKTSQNGTLSLPSLSSDRLSSISSDISSPVTPLPDSLSDEPVEPILDQFAQLDEELLRPRSTTIHWDPTPLLQKLYSIPEPLKQSANAVSYVNIEGYLEKLPSGRKKATFWNAWKRRYFKAKDGYLYYYQNNQTDRPSMILQLMGGKIDCMETTMLGIDDGKPTVMVMLGIDDGKGHYVVVRCSTKQETERWRKALLTHTVENFSSTYIQPWPIPTSPAMIKDTIIIDLGSCSMRAGILCTQPTLPQVFFPTIVAVVKDTKQKVFGFDSLLPDVRGNSILQYPVRPSAKITKYSVDVSALTGLLQKVFTELNVDQKDYNVQLCVPRNFNPSTQAEILKILFDKFGIRALNLTHQAILALYSYNATSGIVVDIGERMDIIPITDGYIIEGGVSRIPYGGCQILDHLRHFLLQKHYSLVSDIEALIIRFILENICYCAQHYNTELTRYKVDPTSFEETVSIKDFFDDQQHCQWDSVTLDAGRFQATEGLFTPDAWGLDNPGLHKLVHRALQECSMDIRKEMTRSIYLSGGVTVLPGFAERLHTELDKVTPSAVTPKVHASPYRYHAAYLGACVLANTQGFDESKVTCDEWQKCGVSVLKRWKM